MTQPTRRLSAIGKLPVVPYREPEAWVPSGGFEESRTPEQQKLDTDMDAEAQDAEGQL